MNSAENTVLFFCCMLIVLNFHPYDDLFSLFYDSSSFTIRWYCISIQSDGVDHMDYSSVKKAIANGNLKAKGRDVLFTEGKSLEKWDEIRTSPYYRSMLHDLVEEGKKLQLQPIPQLSYSIFKLFDETGSRVEYEKLYFARRHRMNVFAILSLVFGDAKYIAELEDTIWAMCDEYTWCLPAHLGGRSLQIPNHNGNQDHHQVIDLFASETAFYLAEIIHLLKDKLSKLVTSRARYEIRERVLDPYCSPGQRYWWETTTMNWASVCAGSIGAAAMYLIQDDETLTPILYRVMETMEAFLQGYGEDGACTEGIGYWSYGFSFYVYFAELLNQRTAGEINLMVGNKIQQMALFHQKCYLHEDYVITFSDASPQVQFRAGMLHFLKAKYPMIELPEERFKQSVVADECARFGALVRDFVWTDMHLQGVPWKDAAYFLPDAEWFITRKTNAGMIYSFAAKGGHNDEPHNHNDLGSFILHAQGDSVLTDLGAGEYTKQYFQEASRYSYLCNSSLGHSVPIIEGNEQMTGPLYKAKVLKVEQEDFLQLFSLDLTEAYPSGNLVKLIRSFTLQDEAHVQLKLKDEYEFLELPSALVERFVTLYLPEIVHEGLIRIKGSSQQLDLIYDAGMFNVQIEHCDFINHQLEQMEVYLIDLHCISLSCHLEAVIEFEINVVDNGT